MKSSWYLHIPSQWEFQQEHPFNKRGRKITALGKNSPCSVHCPRTVFMCINTLKPSTLNSFKKPQSTNNFTFCVSGEILGYLKKLVFVTWPVPASFSFLFKRWKPQTTEPSNTLGVSIKEKKIPSLTPVPAVTREQIPSCCNCRALCYRWESWTFHWKWSHVWWHGCAGKLPRLKPDFG